MASQPQPLLPSLGPAILLPAVFLHLPRHGYSLQVVACSLQQTGLAKPFRLVTALPLRWCPCYMAQSSVPDCCTAHAFYPSPSSCVSFKEVSPK